MAAPRQLEYSRIKMEDGSTAFGTAADMSSGTTGMPWTDYGVVQSNVLAERDKFTGNYDIEHVDVAGQDLRGAASAQVHPDNAILLLKKWPGIPRTSQDNNTPDNETPRYTVEFKDAARNKYYRHKSVKVDTVRISCAGPEGELLANYDLIGHSEVEVTSFSRPSMPDQASFQFKHTHDGSTSKILFGGSAEDNINQFEVTVPNNQQPQDRRDTNGHVLNVDAGIRGPVTFTATLRSHTDWVQDYHGLLRGQNTGFEWKATFDYPGTGSPVDQVVIRLPRLVLSEVTRQGAVRDVQTVALAGTARRTATEEAIVITTA